MKRVLWFLSVLSLSVILIAMLQPTRANAAGPVKILNFQLGGIGIYPQAGTSTLFGQFAWTPTVSLGVIGVRGEVGVTGPKNGVGNRFLAMNYEVLAQLSLAPALTLEGGGGFHNWMSGNGGMNGALSGGIAIAFAGIDHLYATYTRLFLGTGVNEFKVGVGINL